MESPGEFIARATRLQAEAFALTKVRCGDYTELNYWIFEAQLRGMNWVDGLGFAILSMQGSPVH
jgi:hypothetical protein